MGLGHEKRRVFLHVRDGQIHRKLENGGTEAFDFVEGRVRAVKTADVELKFGPVRMLEIEIEDGSGETFCLGTSLHGSVGRSILNSLASVDRLGVVRFRPYKNKSDYTAMFITSDGERLNWKEPVPEKKVDKHGVVDTTDREVFTERLVKEVAAKLNGGPAVSPQGNPAGEPFQGATNDDVPF